MAQLNYLATEINTILAKALAAANTGALDDLHTTDKSSLVNAINESLTLAGLPSQTDNANKFLMTDGSTPSWENLGDSVSISGAIASFKRSRAGARLYPKIFFNPVQSGTGDPSPSNVRAISGWSQVAPTRTGKNLLDPTLYNGGTYNPTVGTTWNLTKSATQFTKSADGTTFTLTTSSTWRYYTMILPCYGLGALHGSFSLSSTGQLGRSMGYLDRNFKVLDKNNLTDATQTYNSNLAPSSNAERAYLYIVISNRGTASATITLTNPQIELGSTATSYEPYNGSTYPISLGSTYYGGYLDTQRGKIVVEWVADNLGSLTWTKSSSGNKFYAKLSEQYPFDGSQTMYCSMYKFDGVGNGTAGYYGNNNTFRYFYQSGASANKEIYVRDDNYSDAPSFKTAVTGQLIAYKLATPLEYDLAEVPNITSLLGINNIWADSGDVEVTIPCDVASLDGNAKLLPSQKTATIKEYSSAHTINKDDYSCLLLVTGATTITLPACEIGTEIEIMRYGTSTVTIAPSGVTINGSSSNQTITTQYQSKKLKCVGATVWVMT